MGVGLPQKHQSAKLNPATAHCHYPGTIQCSTRSKADFPINP
ncbi:hypothetical protein C943_01298 [Mariniradius saccharolyticus AK6]|uniref:Uncharacterized protein n=1 Tax=Mariniradius saccharolyticus AK6 TaxID=1239962 RepID=M7Y5N5_9BACT|nr:hypothetical protein C943_01298 [Mariniradius saccharolyticus AK6]